MTRQPGEGTVVPLGVGPTALTSRMRLQVAHLTCSLSDAPGTCFKGGCASPSAPLQTVTAGGGGAKALDLITSDLPFHEM